MTSGCATLRPTFAFRDSGCDQEIVAIDWNFNGWGGTNDRPPRAGDRLASKATSIFGVPRISVGFVAEGGAKLSAQSEPQPALVTDGRGTMITTVRRGMDRQHMIEAEMGKLGTRKVIWLEGDPCEPITSGHTDGYVQCAPDGVVLVESCDDKTIEPPMWREHDIALLENARDADGRKLKVMHVRAPRSRYWKGNSETFAPCYLNAYVVNGAVITARFGDVERDEFARKALTKAFPEREIIMLRIDSIAEGGGGIHCLTQPMPAFDGGGQQRGHRKSRIARRLG